MEQRRRERGARKEMNRVSTETKSRRLAREMAKKIHPFIRPDQHVHHIDGNPMNNSIENLCVLPASFHTYLHHYGKPNKFKNIRRTDLKRDLATLERLLRIYNEGFVDLY